MARKHWILILAADRLRLAEINRETEFHDLAASPDAGPEAIASAVRQCLDEHGHRGEPIAIGLASPMCLASAVPHAGRKMVRNHQSMAYALEEFLPVAAEDMVCDFVVFDRDALGVAVEVSVLRPLLSALEEAVVPVSSITPIALLALQYLAGIAKRQGRQVVLWQDADSVELFELTDGKPHSWKTIPATVGAVTRELKILQTAPASSQPEGRTLCNLTTQLLEAAGQAAEDVPVSAEQISVESAAARHSAAVLSGRESPWIELCREQFGDYDPYRPIRVRVRLLVTAAACLLLSSATAVWIRADKYDNLAGQYQREQEEVFHGAFPGKRVPVGIRSRLQSECQKLAGVTGKAGNVPRLESAALLMRDALAPLPDDLRYRLLEIRLEEGQVFFDGEVRRHGDADLLATALRSSGFKVDAPHTEQLVGRGVAVTITAACSSDEVATKEGPSP